jgi:hypothetical protein
LLSGAGVNDVGIDREGRVLPLEQLVRGLCERESLALVTYSLGSGATSWPTLPEGRRIHVNGRDRDEHPALALQGVVADVRAGGEPAIVLFDYVDEVLPVDSGPDLRLGLLVETIKAFTSDVPDWQARGFQLVLVDRGGGVHQRLAHQPGIRLVEVPPPDSIETTIYLDLKQAETARVRLYLDPRTDTTRMARRAGGLLLRILGELAALSSPERPVGEADLSRLKGGAIRPTSHGTLAYVSDIVEFATDVAGQHVPRLLVEQELAKGKTTLQVVLCGPAGTGKSRAAMAIAAMLGVPLVRLATIAAPLMGQTEGNIRAAIQTLRAMAPVCLFMDEVEKGALGSSTSHGQTGNEAYSDVAQQIFELTGDTDDDSGISIVAATNVPTWLDGRTMDRFKFLPVLLASGPEIAQVMTIQARRARVPLVDDVTDLMTAYIDGTRVLSGRSSHEVLEAAHNAAIARGSEVVTREHVALALGAYRGTDWTPEAEYSTLTSLMMASLTDRLPWEAARLLGEDFAVPAYLSPYLTASGELDNAVMRRRVAELEAAGVYR